MSRVSHRPGGFRRADALSWLRPARFFAHYLAGRGAPLPVPTGRLLDADDRLRSCFCRAVCRGAEAGLECGSVSLPQWLFSSWSWRLTVGSVDIRWACSGSSVTAAVAGAYRWHPGEPRLTEALHRWAAGLERWGARPFALAGEACRLPWTRVRSEAEQRTVPPRDRLYL